MTTNREMSRFLVLGLVLCPACGGSGPTSAKPKGAQAQLILATEPPGALGVRDARASARDGERIVVVGRIGGDVKPWVEGRTAFVIVDSSLKPCNEIPGDDCPTPWDYCCDTDRLAAAKATVKFVDEKGRILAGSAQENLGVTELQTVVVQGTAKRDEAGNLVVLAQGLFVRPAGGKAGKTP